MINCDVIALLYVFVCMSIINLFLIIVFDKEHVLSSVSTEDRSQFIETSSTLHNALQGSSILE